MFNELNITISNQKHKAFFMNGFHTSSDAPTSNLHKHNFAEIHFVAGGSALFRIGEKQTKLDDGGIMIIPPNIFHCCIQKERGALHNAFQIDYDVSEVKVCSICAETVSAFFDEIDSCKKTGNYSKVASYIVLLCSALSLDTPQTAKPVTDYGFLVQEYMSIHYSDKIQLSDLASELHLSLRQTERLVKEHTGKSFRDELCSIRMNIAKQLMESTAMSLSEIARYVGYDSYSGFWKAAEKCGISFPDNRKTQNTLEISKA